MSVNPPTATEPVPAGPPAVAGEPVPTASGGLLRSLRSSNGLRFFVFKIGRAVLIVIAATMLTQWLLGMAPGGVAF